MSNIYIFTLNWNAEDKLKELIPSLDAAVDQFSDNHVYWFFRDNGSKDDVKNVLSLYQHDLTSFFINHNRASFAEGMNFLFQEANPSDDDLILLLNNDIVIKNPNSLVKMYDLQQRTKADAVGARLLYKNTNKLQHAGVIFSKKYNNLPYHFRPGEESDKNAEKNRYFQAVTAACCIVTASAFRQVKGFSNEFRWAFDDVDLFLKMGQTGGKIAYCGETEIYHEESASLKKNPVNKMFMGSNVEYFRKKWTGKYQIDHNFYLKDSGYKEIK